MTTIKCLLLLIISMTIVSFLITLRYHSIATTHYKGLSKTYSSRGQVEETIVSRPIDEFWSVREITQTEIRTNLSSWDFSSKVKCPELVFSKYPLNREQLYFYCDPKPNILVKMTNSSSDVMTVDFGNTCLKKVIDVHCSDDMLVPNVLHYVWYGNNEISFFHFLSFLSVVRFMKPCLMIFHGEHLPKGKYWDVLIRLYPRVVHMRRDLVKKIYNQKLAFPEHGSDVMRIEGLYEYGGVYLDIDLFLLRSINSLRRFRCTLSQAIPGAFSNGFIMAERNSTFLKLWHEGYKNYSKLWAHNSLFYPYHLYEMHKDLLHVEGFNFVRPNFKHLGQIFDVNYDWSTNFGMHMYVRFYKRPFNETTIRTLNATLGAVSRHILFGNKELCLPDNETNFLIAIS